MVRRPRQIQAQRFSSVAGAETGDFVEQAMVERLAHVRPARARERRDRSACRTSDRARRAPSPRRDRSGRECGGWLRSRSARSSVCAASKRNCLLSSNIMASRYICASAGSAATAGARGNSAPRAAVFSARIGPSIGCSQEMAEGESPDVVGLEARPADRPASARRLPAGSQRRAGLGADADPVDAGGRPRCVPLVSIAISKPARVHARRSARRRAAATARRR